MGRGQYIWQRTSSGVVQASEELAGLVRLAELCLQGRPNALEASRLSGCQRLLERHAGVL